MCIADSGGLLRKYSLLPLNAVFVQYGPMCGRWTEAVIADTPKLAVPMEDKKYFVDDQEKKTQTDEKTNQKRENETKEERKLRHQVARRERGVQDG